MTGLISRRPLFVIFIIFFVVLYSLFEEFSSILKNFEEAVNFLRCAVLRKVYDEFTCLLSVEGNMLIAGIIAFGSQIKPVFTSIGGIDLLCQKALFLQAADDAGNGAFGAVHHFAQFLGGDTRFLLDIAQGMHLYFCQHDVLSVISRNRLINGHDQLIAEGCIDFVVQIGQQIISG